MKDGCTQPASPGRTAKFPPWLRKRIPTGGEAVEVGRLLKELGLATVCSGAHCPNLPECYARGTATFLILGDACTRSCRFCAIRKAAPGLLREDEPEAVSEACERLRLRHVVITSVTRDDLPDGGAGHFARTIRAVRTRLPQAAIEVLVPDFQGREADIDAVLAAGPDIFNHNVETAPRLYATVRPEADYRRSLAVLAHARRQSVGLLVSEPCSIEGATGCLQPVPDMQHGLQASRGTPDVMSGAELAPHGNGGPKQARVYTKSGLMVGLGETPEEVRAVLTDLRGVGCDIVTIGQYLAPSAAHLPVARFVEPAEFEAYECEARSLGFAAAAAGPFVRSSYEAEHVFADAERGANPNHI
jgi:lipoic acid synthetase